MKLIKYLFALIFFLWMAGCTREPTPPADFWGVAGFSYEADSVSGGKHDHSGPTATTVIGFEKQLGGGLGIGGEVAGIGH